MARRNVQSIQIKLQRAKGLFNDHKYQQCKQLILEIIESGNDDYKLLSKLADVCIEIGEYKNAEKYYVAALNKYPQNAVIHTKYGNVLHQYLHNNSKAQIMYERSIEIDSNNDNSWFNYGKLLFKMKKYSHSEHCYKQCIRERACIDYHYALLLLSYKPNDQSTIRFLLQKATKIQPQVAKYHYQHAQCLASMSLNDEAKQEYKTAAVLTHYEDIYILYDFAKFLCERLRDYDSAKTLLQTALKLNDVAKYQFVELYYKQINDESDKYKCKYKMKEFKYEYSESDDDEQQYLDEVCDVNNVYYHENRKENNQKKRKKKKNKKNGMTQNVHTGVQRGRGVHYRWKPKFKPKPNGLKVLDNLPVRMVSQKEANTKIECRICMDQFKFGDKRKTLPCFHSEFHDYCISHWLKDNESCPICLHVVTKLV